MPQSWPSQWILLFILFIVAYFFMMTLTYFFSTKLVSTKKSFLLNSLPVFIWQW